MAEKEEGTPLTYHQIMQELHSNGDMARQFVHQLCEEGYVLGMGTLEDMMKLPEEDLKDIAVHMFPCFFLRECTTINEYKH